MDNENVVYSLDEATKRFEHSMGTILCRQGEESKECSNLEEVKEFYSEYQQINS